MSGLRKGNKEAATSPAMMQSLDSMFIHDEPFFINANSSLRDIPTEGQCDKVESFLLIDKQENLKISSVEQFTKRLNCIEKDRKVKVVSIFGNTGDGKSYTLNQIFFKGKEVFKTSNNQSSCTLGVWAAFDPHHDVICLDTEGLLGVTVYENERMRLLLKVFAISDIVIYCTSSGRLNKDLFVFFGAACQAYDQYFRAALQLIKQKEEQSERINSLTVLSPSIIILQETKHTEPLSNNGFESPEDILKTQFAQMGLEMEFFNTLKYVGLKTTDSTIDYEPLQDVIRNELDNTMRSARHLHFVYRTLKILNDNFSGEIENFSKILFPDQYFSCPIKCLSCGCRCSNNMEHLRNGKPHHNNTKCKYQHQYKNKIYRCKRCHANGKKIEVTESDKSWYGLAIHAWCGYVIECPNCGEIYRSRQYWYGNKNPEEEAVYTNVSHVWNMPNLSATSQNTAQRMIDGVSYITEAISNVSLQPTKALSAWMTDQVAPSYWRPNVDIKHCQKCRTLFEPTDTKHHCRSCGEGFCAKCSSRTKCVPSRNWYTPVRVCDICFVKNTNSNDEFSKPIEDVNARKMTEHVVSTLSTVGTVLSYSKSFIKDTVRPSYWVPDSEITGCCVCQQKFSAVLTLHHCRDCGYGVCQNCSVHRKPVPYRGWDKPVRVCDSCMKLD